jgi:transketolase
MAHSAKIDGSKRKFYCLVGDGECNEGSVWEAAMYAKHHKLDNLTVIIDKNNLQAMGDTKDIIDMAPFAGKWSAFGFEVIEIDGHNHEEIKSALSTEVNGKPAAIIANTVKGKGVSFMENNILWHYRSPRDDDYERAMKEL